MNNFYLAEFFPARPVGRKHRLLANAASWMNLDADLIPRADPTTQMTTAEQRLNLWHLAEQVLAYRVPGDFADLGCFEGQTSAVFARLLAQHDSARRLHLYDSFEHTLGFQGDVKSKLLQRFRDGALPEPILHEGRFEDTLPRELPDQIAFAQIDCGVGGPHELHRKLVEHCLHSLWPRLSPGAVCVVQDYCDPANRQVTADYYPFIKPTLDRFLAEHALAPVALVSGVYPHAFFRKPLG